ncbi:MAG: response regulator [candidate division Zixibacteria bacterium]|nr:response regulator [candidate division Zixibacteria bacterium]
MTESNNNSYRILAVDDEDIVQSLIRDALEDEGHEVITAASGKSALEVLESKPVDLLITDIRMPHMSGTELVERARLINPSIGVVFITGYASLTSAKDAIKQGALDYIMKPFDLAEIRNSVRNAIAKLSEMADATSHDRLDSLSDLSHVLFGAGDRRSLATSSLKFAMMHLKSQSGSILFWDATSEQYLLLNINGDTTNEETIGREPLYSLATQGDLADIQKPCLVTSFEDHPIYQCHANPQLEPFLIPNWVTDEAPVVTVPIMRPSMFHGLVTLSLDSDITSVDQSDFKFLAVTANQLAISLENLGLLEESQQAYSRLRELQNETIELEKMATRGIMSAEIGHELNNFLGVVSGNVELLKMHAQKGNLDKLDKYVNAVTSTLARMKSFTDNLMDLGSISSHKETIRFDHMIREVVDYIQPQKRFEGIELSLPDEIEPINVYADHTQMQQLLYNLFHNAADAMVGCEQRLISVNVSVDSDLNSFQITIRDTGVGFEQDLLNKAFHEKFTTKKSGHGFGLVICKRIIDNHNGELQVESTPGEGTRISITFPLATDKEPNQRTPANQTA